MFYAVSPTAATCDEECYVSIHLVLFPQICRNEMEGAYALLSVVGDGDASSISQADIDAWCADIKYTQDPPSGKLAQILM